MVESPLHIPTPGKIETKKDIYQCLKNWIIYSDLKPGEPIKERTLSLEKLAASLAAARRSEEDVAQLEALISDLKTTLENNDTQGFIRLDQKYHEMMGWITQNPVMAETLEALHNPCLRYWFLNRHRIELYKEIFDELQCLTQAIKNKNSDLAARLNGEHVNGFLTLLNL